MAARLKEGEIDVAYLAHSGRKRKIAKQDRERIEKRLANKATRRTLTAKPTLRRTYDLEQFIWEWAAGGSFTVQDTLL